MKFGEEEHPTGSPTLPNLVMMGEGMVGTEAPKFPVAPLSSVILSSHPFPSPLFISPSHVLPSPLPFIPSSFVPSSNLSSPIFPFLFPVHPSHPVPKI